MTNKFEFSTSTSDATTSLSSSVPETLAENRVEESLPNLYPTRNPSGIFGFTRAKELGLNFTKAFSQQFIMSKEPGFKVSHLRRSRAGDWTVLTGNGLPVAAVHSSRLDMSVVFLGQGVDADGVLVDQKVLEEKVDRIGSAQAIADDLNDCGGRFAFVVVAPGFQRLYLDPSGTLGAVYNQKAGLVASTVHLAVTRPLMLPDEYPAARIAYDGEGGRWAFGYTPDRDVNRLLANHYLDLASFQMVRHWPTADEDFTCPMRENDIRERLDQIIARHKVIMNALIRNNEPAILPISGGADSRLLLAFAKESFDQVDLFFTHKTNLNTARDMEVAEILAERAGVELTKFDLVGDKSLLPREARCIAMDRHYKLAEGLSNDGKRKDQRHIAERMVLPPGGVVLRGHVTDLSKAVLWRDRGVTEFLRSEGKKHAPSEGVRLMMIGLENAAKNSWLLERYRNWMDSLPENARIRTLDFMELEQFRSHGHGAIFYGFLQNFFIGPGCDRSIIRNLIALPPHLRRHFYINDMMLEQCAPEFLDVPYTRQADNDRRQTRKALKDILKQGPEVL